MKNCAHSSLSEKRRVPTTDPGARVPRVPDPNGSVNRKWNSKNSYLWLEAGILLPFFLVCLLGRSLAAESGPGYRRIPLSVPASGRTGFTLLDPAQTGINFTNTLSDQNAAQNQIRLNGSGVSLGDIDGDGLCDIFVCSLEGHLALYRNLGEWRFTNITAAAGLDFPSNFSTGSTLADVNRDGHLALLVKRLGQAT